jgi:phosphoribosylformimino-5-aminoimidazole carboxamide ribotide isomerase
MEFRPCIDLHQGKVKQIVGGSLRDDCQTQIDNFISEKDAVFYAKYYQNLSLHGGHCIILDSPQSANYKLSQKQAISALNAYPQGMHVGGSITPENAAQYLDAGASHVIVTSYVFYEGKIHYERLKHLVKTIGKNRLVLDLSCRKVNGAYHIVTNRWQTVTDELVTSALLQNLSNYADEFLVHGVDVEGLGTGIEEELIEILSAWNEIPITYAGGVHSKMDIERIKQIGKDRIHVTVGSALTLFGGTLSMEDVMQVCAAFVEK